MTFSVNQEEGCQLGAFSFAACVSSRKMRPSILWSKTLHPMQFIPTVVSLFREAITEGKSGEALSSRLLHRQFLLVASLFPHLKHSCPSKWQDSDEFSVCQVNSLCKKRNVLQYSKQRVLGTHHSREWLWDSFKSLWIHCRVIVLCWSWKFYVLLLCRGSIPSAFRMSHQSWPSFWSPRKMSAIPTTTGELPKMSDWLTSLKKNCYNLLLIFSWLPLPVPAYFSWYQTCFSATSQVVLLSGWFRCHALPYCSLCSYFPSCPRAPQLSSVRGPCLLQASIQGWRFSSNPWTPWCSLTSPV